MASDLYLGQGIPHCPEEILAVIQKLAYNTLRGSLGAFSPF